MKRSPIKALSDTVHQFQDKAYAYERRATASMTMSTAVVFSFYGILMLSYDFFEKTDWKPILFRLCCTGVIVFLSALYTYFLRRLPVFSTPGSIWKFNLLYYSVVILLICSQSMHLNNVSIVPLFIILLGFGTSWLHSRQYISFLTVVMLVLFVLTLENGFDYYWFIEFLIFYLFALALHLTQVKLNCKLFQYQDLIEEERNHDTLTGLMNRRAIDDALQNYRREKSMLAAIMVDLDHFKEVNDSFGHDAGDLALQSASEIFRQVFLDQALIARLGGDEFLILFALDPGEEESLTTSLQALLDAVPLSFRGQEKEVRVTFSAGCALAARAELRELCQLITKADAAMYQVKLNGRNGVSITWASGAEEQLHGGSKPAKTISLES